MGYNVYWSGDIAVEPQFSSQKRTALARWLGMDGYRLNEIDDAKLRRKKDKEGWQHWQLWNPVDTIAADHITIENEGLPPYLMALILARIIERCPDQTFEGDLYWDGDEQEDIGSISVKDREVWVCHAAIVYPAIGSKDAEKVTL